MGVSLRITINEETGVKSIYGKQLYRHSMKCIHHRTMTFRPEITGVCLCFSLLFRTVTRNRVVEKEASSALKIESTFPICIIYERAKT